MATVLLILVVVLVMAALVFGVVSLLSGDDPGLVPAEPDGRALPLPNTRSLTESDLQSVRFDVGLRGYRMAQVDRVLRRTAYDIGYKDEMIAVLEAEVTALREGRTEDADLLRKARESAANASPATAAPAGRGEPITVGSGDRSGPGPAGADTAEFARGVDGAATTAIEDFTINDRSTREPTTTEPTTTEPTTIEPTTEQAEQTGAEPTDAEEWAEEPDVAADGMAERPGRG